MLLRLYNDNSELIDHSKKSFNKPSESEANGESGEAIDADAASGAAAEEEVILAENRADAAKQEEKDDTRETAEGDVVAREDDVVNTTV